MVLVIVTVTYRTMTPDIDDEDDAEYEDYESYYSGEDHEGNTDVHHKISSLDFATLCFDHGPTRCSCCVCFSRISFFYLYYF